MTTPPRVALATCTELREYDEDAAPLVSALAERDIHAEMLAWDDPAAEWASRDLVVIRSTWNYTTKHEEFVAWAQGMPRLLNSSDIVRWNTDKTYLDDLAAAGIPVVPTVFLRPGDTLEPPAAGDYVVKPAVGAGARDTARYRAEEANAATQHVARLHRAGSTVMVQPYIDAVDSSGESSLLYLGGTFSHSVRKGPLLCDGAEVDANGQPTIAAREPTADELSLAEQALRAVPAGSEPLLYARVDILPGADGSPVLLELELTEPHMYLSHSPGAVQRFAAAIAHAVGRTVPVARP
ncbi:MAG: hypothetical protein WCB04_11905 [Mycobacteriales bacterium]